MLQEFVDAERCYVIMEKFEAVGSFGARPERKPKGGKSDSTLLQGSSKVSGRRDS